MIDSLIVKQNPYSIQFPVEIDPFAELFSLSPDEIQTRSNNSYTDGYAPFKAAIAPVSQREIEKIQEIVKPYLNDAESIITIEDPEIDATENQFFRHLYQSVYHQNWIRLIGDESFVSTCKMAIITLLQVDIGRSLLLTAYRSHQQFIIQQSETAHVGTKNEDISLSSLHIFMPLKLLYYPAVGDDGEIYIETLPFFITLGHELLHCLQRISLQARASSAEEGIKKVNKLFGECGTSDPQFPNTLERLTILGIDNLIPSENALHYAFGTKRCCSYFSTGFPPANSFETVPPDQKIKNHTRIERAAYFGFSGEVKRLIRFGEDPTEALYGALHCPSRNVKLIPYLIESTSVDIQKQLPHQNSTVLKRASDLFNANKLSPRLYHIILSNLFKNSPTTDQNQRTDTEFVRTCRAIHKWLEKAFHNPAAL